MVVANLVFPPTAHATIDPVRPPHVTAQVTVKLDRRQSADRRLGLRGGRRTADVHVAMFAEDH